MKKLIGVFFLLVFVFSFGAGLLMSVNSAEAGCAKTCAIINCIPEKVCVCDGVPKCCHCVPRP